jgi:renalase
MSFDVAVVGAGIAGLVCAQQLRRSGYRVVVLEKSRGLGGRVATRRLAGTWADHGLRYLEVQGALSTQLIQTLVQQGIVHQWADSQWADSPRYVAPDGITAIAKFLSTGLEIRRSQRVQTLTLLPDRTWSLTLEAADQADLTAAAVVLAIPAPQALALLEPLADRLPPASLEALQSVQFAPCITAIATYPAGLAKLSQTQAQLPDADIAWVGLEFSKQTSRLEDSKLAIVVQSSAAFADRHLDQADLNAVGRHLITEAKLLDPEELQVHRWRYAFVSHPWQEPTLSFDSALWCCGDWCGGDRLENALQSGLATAAQLATDKETASFAELLEAL